MKLKKLLAGTMAAVLMLGSTTVLAGSLGGNTEGTGNGEFEGYVKEECYAYTLPTVASTGGFDFILDPQGLVATASGTATTFASATSYTTGSMYFKNVSGSSHTYSQKSDAMTITNNGSVDIDITLTATVTPNSSFATNASVAFTTDSAFATDAGASIYLALTDNNITKPIATASGSSYKATMDATVKGSKEAYGIVASGDSYVYKQTVADYASFASYSFYLTGASGGDWSKFEANNGQEIFDVKVVWDVKKHVEAPAEAAPDFTTGTQAGTISYTQGSGKLALKKIEHIEMTNDGGTFDGYNENKQIPYDGATVKDNVITFAQNFLKYYTKDEYTAKVIYKNMNDDTKETFVTVKTK